MKLFQHPEWVIYQQDQATFRQAVSAIRHWQASGQPLLVTEYDLVWTVNSARQFVQDMAAWMRAYNQVLWDVFPYCRLCGGGCCQVGASYASVFDALALVLLDETLPELAEWVEAGPRDCIYLVKDGCSWPAGWKDLKCALFYCLGATGSPEIAARRQVLYRQVSGELARVTARLLPEPLRRHPSLAPLAGRQEPAAEVLALFEEPLSFAESLSEALNELFVAPLVQRFPIRMQGPKHEWYLDSQPGGLQDWDPADGSPSNPEERALLFMAEAAEEIPTLDGSILPGSAVSIDDFASDLEQLEWILLARPPEARRTLQTMSDRYGAGQPGSEQAASLGGRLNTLLLDLLHSWPSG